MSTPEPYTLLVYNPATLERVRELLQEIHPEDPWDDAMLVGYVLQSSLDNLRSRASRLRRAAETPGGAVVPARPSE